MRKTCCLVAVLLLAASLLPTQAQNSGDSQACQGSTIDNQGADVAKMSRAFLAKLQAAVHDGNKTKVASMVSYPLMVIQGSRRTRIKTKSEFLARYDTLFDAHVQSAIAKQSANCLFGNYQGAMIGNGEVWFSQQQEGSMKIITVNPTASSQ
jgi:hypothetical protein